MEAAERLPPMSIKRKEAAIAAVGGVVNCGDLFWI